MIRIKLYLVKHTHDDIINTFNISGKEIKININETDDGRKK